MLFVIGDIHGAAKGLQQCLDRSGFSSSDTLICLGDIVDGWSETKECLDILMKIPNLILLRGNHDQWFLDWTTGKISEDEFRSWVHHGGGMTIQSLTNEMLSDYEITLYDRNFKYRAHEWVNPKYINFLNSSELSYRKDNNFFCHAGVDINLPENEQNENILTLSRSLVRLAWTQQNEPYIKYKGQLEWTKEVQFWVGHTPIVRFNGNLKTPQKWANVNLMDTDAAFKGCISIKNLDTNEVYQSDPCYKLYPNEKGRN